MKKQYDPVIGLGFIEEIKEKFLNKDPTKRFTA
jgi:hypothetical protein